MSIESQRLSKTTLGWNLSRQSLRGFLLVLVLVPTLLVWAAIGSSLFGYRAASAHGISMEPILRDGDALWVKPLDVANLHVGDIVTLVPPGEESVTHRVVKVEPLSKDSYLVVTKGDANYFTEEWEISSDWTVAVVVARIPFGGYVLDFLASIFGKALMVSVLVTLAVTWVRRRRLARGGGQAKGSGTSPM